MSVLFVKLYFYEATCYQTLTHLCSFSLISFCYLVMKCVIDEAIDDAWKTRVKSNKTIAYKWLTIDNDTWLLYRKVYTSVQCGNTLKHSLKHRFNLFLSHHRWQTNCISTKGNTNSPTKTLEKQSIP